MEHSVHSESLHWLYYLVAVLAQTQAQLYLFLYYPKQHQLIDLCNIIMICFVSSSNKYSYTVQTYFKYQRAQHFLLLLWTQQSIRANNSAHTFVSGATKTLVSTVTSFSRTPTSCSDSANNMNATYSSHSSCHSTSCSAFSFTDVWYFSLPSAIVTNASLVPVTHIPL